MKYQTNYIRELNGVFFLLMQIDTFNKDHEKIHGACTVSIPESLIQYIYLIRHFVV